MSLISTEIKTEQQFEKLMKLIYITITNNLESKESFHQRLKVFSPQVILFFSPLLPPQKKSDIIRPKEEDVTERGRPFLYE